METTILRDMATPLWKVREVLVSSKGLDTTKVEMLSNKYLPYVILRCDPYFKPLQELSIKSDKKVTLKEVNGLLSVILYVAKSIDHLLTIKEITRIKEEIIKEIEKEKRLKTEKFFDDVSFNDVLFS